MTSHTTSPAAVTSEPRGVPSVELVTDPGRLHGVRAAWEDLWSRCPQAGLFQSPGYCLDAWDLVEERRGRRLACVLGWQDDRLVAVWPFVLERNRLWTWARQLAASGVESHELLVDPAVDRVAWARRAWSSLVAQAGVDVVTLSSCDASADAPALRGLPALTVETATDESVFVPLRDEVDWDGFYGSLSRSHRKDLAKSRRRLEALGSLGVEVLEAGDPRIPALVDWTLQQKRCWAEDTGKKGDWLWSEDYHRFLVRQLQHPGTEVRNVLLVTTLDGEVLATQVGAVGKSRFHAVIAGFDAAHRKHSPGARMNEFLVRWCWEQDLDCDFGGGAEAYKRFWSRGCTSPATHRTLAVSRWGWVALAVRRAAHRLRAAVSALRPPAAVPAPAPRAGPAARGPRPTSGGRTGTPARCRTTRR